MKRIMLVLFLAILLVGTVSAEMEFDNVKSYDAETKTATIKDNFGVGNTLAEITLTSPLNMYVIRGEDRLVAEFTIKNTQDYDSVFNTLEFYNMKDNMKGFTRGFQYKYKTYKDALRQEYDLICNNPEDNFDCTKENKRNVTYQIPEWKPLNHKAILPSGDWEIGIFTDVLPNERVEWIPTLYGEEIEEWAVWTEALSSNIQAYYSFNESSGTNAPDLHDFDNNFTTFKSPTWDTGLIGNALHFDGTSQYALQDNNLTLEPNMTVNLWFNLDAIDGADQQQFFGRFGMGGQGEFEYNVVSGTTNIRPQWRQSNGTSFSLSDQDIGLNWTMVTMVANSTHLRFYINATAVQTIGYDGTASTNATNTSIGGRTMPTSNDNWFDGLIDEMGFWNRTLSDAEVTQLFNGGSGISFVKNFLAFSVTLIAPANNTETILTTLEFQANLTSTQANLTNTTLTIWDPNNTIFKTNTTTFPSNTSNNLTNLSISGFQLKSGYQWNFFTCVDNSTGSVVCDFSASNRTINILPFEIDTETFTPEVFETSSQIFEINITTIPSILSLEAILNYNGTRNLASTTCDGENCSITEIIDIPLVSATDWENKSFFWEITVFDGTLSSTINTSANEQNVTRIHLEACDATFTTQTLNFTTYDEQTLDRISPFSFDGTLDFWLGSGTVIQNNSISDNVTEMTLCLTPNQTMIVDAIIDYDSSSVTNYTNRFYYFDDKNIDNVSEDIFMYLLESSASTSFILEVEDESLLPVTNALIEIHRFYPGEGIFRIVQIARTDDNGKSIGFFQTETVDYKFIIKQNGVILLETEQQKIIPESSPFTLTFNTGDVLEEPWASQEDLTELNSSLIWNSTSGIVTYIYIDTSGNFTLARLRVIQESLVNSTNDTTICNVNLSISSGTLLCTVGSNDGVYVASSFITRSTEVLDKQFTFQIETLSGVVGFLGLFYGWFLVLIASFMFKFNEIAGIWAVTITIFLINIFGLINFGGVFVTGTIAVAIILTWIMEK